MAQDSFWDLSSYITGESQNHLDIKGKNVFRNDDAWKPEAETLAFRSWLNFKTSSLSMMGIKPTPGLLHWNYSERVEKNKSSTVGKNKID